MNITQRLLQLDPTLQMHNEGEWSGTNSLYSAFNDAGVECETGEFLYSLVRLMKPDRILETGTHQGIGASYMGLALLDNNNRGTIDTVEFLQPHFDTANERFNRIGIKNIVANYLMDVKNYKPTTFNLGNDIYDIILLDTEPQTRFAELVKFYPYLKEGGFIFIHDLHRHMGQMPNTEHGFAWPWGLVPAEMHKLVKQGKLRPFHFTTPRGLTGFYKVSKEDFIWPKTQSNQ